MHHLQGLRGTYASGNSSGHLGAKHVRAILIMMTLVIFYKVQWSMGKLTLCSYSCRMSCKGKKTQGGASYRSAAGGNQAAVGGWRQRRQAAPPAASGKSGH